MHVCVCRVGMCAILCPRLGLYKIPVKTRNIHITDIIRIDENFLREMYRLLVGGGGAGGALEFILMAHMGYRKNVDLLTYDVYVLMCVVLVM